MGRLLLLVLVAAVLAVAVVLRYANLPLESLPLPRNIQAQEELLQKRRQQLVLLEAERSQRDQAFRTVKRRAVPFWQIQSKTPTADIPTEFYRLARQAHARHVSGRRTSGRA